MAKGSDGIKKLMDALEDPTPILERIGALGSAYSQRAFEIQQFGDDQWAQKYPNQEEPFINIAGVISDFNFGKSRPRVKNFQRTPALVDSGFLKKSITHEVEGKESVRWGTSAYYAQKLQDGGTNTIPITPDAKDRMRAWLFTKKGKVRKGREGYAKKLKRFLNPNIAQYTVKITPRPFVGITEQLSDDIKEMLKRYFEEKVNGRS